MPFILLEIHDYAKPTETSICSQLVNKGLATWFMTTTQCDGYA